MMIVLPGWVFETEKKLRKIINDVAIKHGIDIYLVQDSKRIDNAVETIARWMHTLSEFSHPMDLDPKEIKEMEKAADEPEKKQKRKRKKGVPKYKISRSRIKRKRKTKKK